MTSIGSVSLKYILSYTKNIGGEQLGCELENIDASEVLVFRLTLRNWHQGAPGLPGVQRFDSLDYT